MVNSGTGHDRCPSGFPEPTWRPGATLWWRLRNYKNRFWFQEGVKFFCPDLDRSAGRYGRAGSGTLRALPLAVSYLRARRTSRSSFRFRFSQRAFSACERFSNAARSASMAVAMPSCSRSAFSSAGFALAVARSRLCRSFALAAPSYWRSLSCSLSALSYSKSAGRLVVGFRGRPLFRLGRLSCGLRPASSSG
jgi:hypothetical protein